MVLHLRPVGPEPARTYWERRAVVALAVLLPVVLLLSLTGGDDDDRLAATATATPSPTAAAPLVLSPAPTPSGTAAATSSPTPTATPSASPGAECADEALQLEAVAGEQVYSVDAEPRLELRITNTGPVPCSRDLGQAAVELLVVSGDDRIWSSDDCAPGGAQDVVVLAPGTPEVARVTWPGTRSLPGCEGDEARALPGTYRVAGRVGDLRQQGASFQLE